MLPVFIGLMTVSFQIVYVFILFVFACSLETLINITLTYVYVLFMTLLYILNSELKSAG